MASSLVIEEVNAGYGAVRVLEGVSLKVRAGEIVVLLGTNGNGKSTLIKCLAGLLTPTSGRIVATIDGREIDLVGRAAETLVDEGISLVPEGRRLFPKLTVEENLLLGAYRSAARDRIGETLEFCFETFPRLRERRRQLAGSMSGGEQQMLALARAVMSRPSLLLIDEPSVGLAPIMVARMIEKIGELRSALGLTILMAEQNFHQAIRIADRGYVLVHGQVALAAETPDELKQSDIVRRLYLGAA